MDSSDIHSIKVGDQEKFIASGCDLLIETARYDFKTFVSLMKTDYIFEWYNERIIEEIENLIIHDKYDNLILEAPPRLGKSELSSRLAPAWSIGVNSERVLLGGDTPYEIILASYSHDLAVEFVAAMTQYIESDMYKKIFPRIRMSPRGQRYGTQFRRSSSDFDMVGDLSGNEFKEEDGKYVKVSSLRAVGIGGTITGKGGDLIIMDDPVKDSKSAMSERLRNETYQWYSTALSTRLENRYGSRGKKLILLTRWHKYDLAGRLISIDEKREKQDWKNIKLPAFAYPKDSKDRYEHDHRNEGKVISKRLDIESKIKDMSKADVSALYQQLPVSISGNIINPNDIQYYKEAPEVNIKIISVDLAYTGKQTSDYSVFALWGMKLNATGGDPNFYLLDQVRGKNSYPEQKRILKELTKKHNHIYKVVIEQAANGMALYDELKREILGLEMWKPQTDKVARLKLVHNLFESKRVFFPDPFENAWVKECIDELCDFPAVKNDDFVDATSMALIHLKAFVSEYGHLKGLI